MLSADWFGFNFSSSICNKSISVWTKNRKSENLWNIIWAIDFEFQGTLTWIYFVYEFWVYRCIIFLTVDAPRSCHVGGDLYPIDFTPKTAGSGCTSQQHILPFAWKRVMQMSKKKHVKNHIQLCFEYKKRIPLLVYFISPIYTHTWGQRRKVPKGFEADFGLEKWFCVNWPPLYCEADWQEKRGSSDG